MYMINQQFNLTSISTLYSSITILFLGLIFLFSRKKIENRSFFIASFTAFLWLSGMAMVESSKNSALALLWYNRYSFLGVAFIPSSVYFLSTALTDQFKKHKRKIFLAYLISSVFYLLVNMTPSFSIKITNWGYYPVYGSSLLGLLYDLYFLLLMVYSFYLLLISHKSISNQLKRKQIKIFSFGLLVATTGSSDFLLSFGYNIYPFGYISILFFIAITAFIVKSYGFLVLEPDTTFQAIFKSIPSFIAGINAEQKIDFINKPLEDALGYKEEEILGKPIYTIFPEKESFIQLKDKVSKEESYTKTEETYLLTKDKKKIPVSFNFSPIYEKGFGKEVFGFVLSAQDLTARNKAEEKMRESEKRFQDVVTNTGDWIWEINTDGKYIYSNSSVMQILGYRVEEILEKHFYDLFSPDDREELKATTFNYLSRKKPFIGFANRNLHKDGHIVIVETSGVPIISPDGTLLGCRGADRDITEQKQNEKLQEVLYNISKVANSPILLEQFYQTIHKELSNIIDTTNFHITLFNEEDNKVYFPCYFDEKDKVPPSYENMSEFSYTFSGYVIKNNQPLLLNREEIYTMIEEGKIKLSQIGTITKEIAWLGVPLTLKDKVIGCMVVLNYYDPNYFSEKDMQIMKHTANLVAGVIDKKQKEEEIKENEQKYRTTLENTGTAMAIMEEDTTISSVNSQFEQLSKYSKKEIEGKMKWTKLVHQDDQKRMLEYHKKRSENPDSVFSQYEFKGVNKNGNILTILVNANIIPNTKKTVVSLIDITEKNKMEEKLREYTEQLEEKVKERTEELTIINKEIKKANEIKNNFLANVSHELRTPLTSIRSFSEILLNYKDEDKATQEEFLKIINKESERLTRLIDDILDISKIEAGRIEWKDEFIYIEKIVSISVNSILPMAEKKSIPIKKEIASNLPFIFADKDRLIQVLENLLSNALKFTDNGEIKIGAKSVGNNLLYYVSDTGIGIKLNDQKNIFNRFIQIEGNRLLREKAKGTGLGLAICSEIVEHYDGKIWVESEVGQGSTFYFTLPATLTKKRTESAIEKTPSSLVEKVILVADDEPNIRRYLNFELSKAGFKVIEASNGIETIQIVKERKPDLLILDILMPIVDGYDVLKKLKTNPQLSSIPIIVLSVLEDRKKGFRLGANAYLNKPLKKEELFSKISELLEKEEKKILLVDDDMDFVKATQFFLEKNGYEVYSASNGEEGLKVCREKKPDLVMLDILMPKKDGIETLKSLKKDPLIQKTPVIILTVNAIKNGETKCLSLGAERYLTKKEKLNSLLIEIKEVLKKQDSNMLNLTDTKGEKYALRIGQEFKIRDGSSENKYWITRFGKNSIYIGYQIYFMGNFQEQEMVLDYQKFFDKFFPEREGEENA